MQSRHAGDQDTIDMMKVGDCQIGFQCEKDKKNLWLGLKIEQTPPSFVGKITLWNFEFPGGFFYECVNNLSMC